MREMRRQRPDVHVLRQIAPGYLFLEAEGSFDHLTAPWRHRLPIYLHHLFPVHTRISIPSFPNDLTEVQTAIQHIAPPNAVVQVRNILGDERLPYPYVPVEMMHSLNRKATAISTRIPSGRIVSVLLACEGDTPQAYLGVSWAAQNLSPWAGGQIPITECVPNRAGYKLLEALAAFETRLRPGDHALDLGAAPGAWTTLLRRRGMRVTAVAPAPLYPWLTYDHEVEHVHELAEDYLTHCQMTFDLIVNDMKLDVQDSAQLMVDYARHLRPEGIAIMTLKLRGRSRRSVTDHGLRILRKSYKILRIRQLVSNRLEVTLFLRRKT